MSILIKSTSFIVVHSLSHVWPFVTPWNAACLASLSLTISQTFPKFMSIESVMPSNHLILCHPLLLLSSVFPRISVFSNELAFHIRWPKYRSFNFSISPSNEYSEFISFRIDWFDPLAVQGTLKSLLQHHSLKASTLHWKAGMCIVGGEKLLVVSCWPLPQNSRIDFKYTNNICKQKESDYLNDNWT